MLLVFVEWCFVFAAIADTDEKEYAEYQDRVANLLSDCFGENWRQSVKVYEIDGTLNSGTLFAIVELKKENFLRIIELHDDMTKEHAVSSEAVLQSEIPEIYIETEGEVSFVYPNGNGYMLSYKGKNGWMVNSYRVEIGNNRAMNVSFFDGPIVDYSIIGVDGQLLYEKLLSGWTDIPLDIRNFNIEDLPRSEEVLLMRTVDAKDNVKAYASSIVCSDGSRVLVGCTEGLGTCDVRVYNNADIYVGSGNDSRVCGMEVLFDDGCIGRVERKYNSEYDYYWGEMYMSESYIQKPRSVVVKLIAENGERVSVAEFVLE